MTTTRPTIAKCADCRLVAICTLGCASEAKPGPTPGGLPGLTDVETEAFLAAIDKSEPAADTKGTP